MSRHEDPKIALDQLTALELAELTTKPVQA